ncbi:hypothetical protein HRbin11_02084 [bacterium HR11]|nr:hypothetical protein HRbin11_02084 [bacterium HR11]
MSQAIEAIRKHHRKILETFQGHLQTLRRRPESESLGALLHFLKTELLPHAVGEERALYPAVEGLLKAWGQATATMIVDHEFIRRSIQALEALAERLRTTSDVAALWGEVETQLLQLSAVLRLHLEKEERVYLPLVERHLSESVQRSILDRMHEVGPADVEAAGSVLDVRYMPPPERHPRIFETFDRLAPGASFILVNDHDPKPLYYEFLHERTGQFAWEYLESGPQVWRVRITKVAPQG